MTIDQTESKKEICLRSYLCKTLFWVVIAAIVVAVFIGLPITHWLM